MTARKPVLSEPQLEMLRWANSATPPGIRAELQGHEFRTRDSLIRRGLCELKLTTRGEPGGYDDIPAYSIVITPAGKLEVIANG